MLATAGFVFVSYGGLTQISALAEEIKNPSRTVPLGLLSALGVTTAAHCLMVFVTSGVLGAESLDTSLTPISEAAAVFMGRGGEMALTAAAMAAFLTTANAGILSASRYLLSLIRDELLPTLLGKVHVTRKTPVPAVITTGVFLIGLFFVPLESLVKMASMVILLTQALANACVVILRESRIHNYQPTFKAPWYPWLQIASLAGVVLLIVEIGLETFLIGSVFIAAGLVFLVLRAREAGARIRAAPCPFEAFGAQGRAVGFGVGAQGNYPRAR